MCFNPRAREGRDGAAVLRHGDRAVSIHAPARGATGADTVVVPTSENLSANEIVNLYNNSGAITARKADAGINKYQANGYVKASTTAPANATIFLDGTCPGTFAATDAGKPVFLSDTAGTTTLTPVSGSGKLHQLIGYVTSTTGFDFEVESPIELA